MNGESGVSPSNCVVLHTQDDAASPSDDTDCCSTDDDPKDPEEDSDGELDCSLDDEGDLIPLYRPHFGDHGNQLHLNAQHLSGTERAGQEDRGDEHKKPGQTDDI